MSDEEFVELVKRHPELAGLARLIENLPTATRAEAIEGFIQFARFYEGRTLEEREAMLEFMAEHASELAAKARH